MKEQIPTEEAKFEVLAGSEAIEALNRSEINSQIATAKQFPRSIDAFIKKASELVTYDEDTAESCFYCLNREGKDIEGESIRMAEIAASAYGNVRYGSRVIAIEEKWVTAQGVALDLECNNAVTSEVRRRITKKDGKRFSDDMIIVTANAACAIAQRNALLKVIPKALLKPVTEAARKFLRGQEKSLPERRKRALEFFVTKGVAQDRIMNALGVKGPADVGADQLERLTGFRNAFVDGTASLDDLFPLVTVKKVEPKKEEEDKVPMGEPEKPKEEPAPEKPDAPQSETQEVIGIKARLEREEISLADFNAFIELNGYVDKGSSLDAASVEQVEVVLNRIDKIVAKIHKIKPKQ